MVLESQIPPQKCPNIVLISNSKWQVDDFVGELTLWDYSINTFCVIRRDRNNRVPPDVPRRRGVYRATGHEPFKLSGSQKVVARSLSSLGSALKSWSSLVNLSDTKCRWICFKKPTPQQDRQLIVSLRNDQQQVDDFVVELTFQNRLVDTCCEIRKDRNNLRFRSTTTGSAWENSRP